MQVIESAPLSTVQAAPTVITTTVADNIVGYGANAAIMPLSNVVGPNKYGVPENLPLLPSDAGCGKCHGTGYKRKMFNRGFKPCKKCARKYGTNVSKWN